MPGGLSRPGLAIKLLANKNCILWVLLPFLSFSSRTYSFPSGSSGFDMVLILILTIGREGSSINPLLRKSVSVKTGPRLSCHAKGCFVASFGSTDSIRAYKSQ